MKQSIKNRWLFLAAGLVLAVAYSVYSAPVEAYGILVDNEVVGHLQSPEDAEAVMEALLDKASDSGRFNVKQLSSVTFEEVKTAPGSLVAPEALPELLERSVEFERYDYEIRIDGEPYARTAGRVEIAALLKLVRDQYVDRTDEAVELEFEENIEVVEVPHDGTPLKNKDQLWAQYQNGREELQTYTVGKGDTAWDIAERFDMSIDELVSANSDIDLTRIQIGQVIHLNQPLEWINVLTTEVVEREQPIIGATLYEKTDAMYVGEYKLKVEGETGLKRIKVKNVYRNGLLQEEQILEEHVMKEPTNTVMLSGAKWREVASSGSFDNPTSGMLTSRFGTRWGRMHSGIDIGAPVGTPIYAADAGVVTSTDYISGYGNTVILDHGNGITTLYAHASEILVQVGQTVEKQELIARVGRTGSTTGACLHFEVRKDGAAIDPLPYVNYQ